MMTGFVNTLATIALMAVLTLCGCAGQSPESQQDNPAQDAIEYVSGEQVQEDPEEDPQTEIIDEEEKDAGTDTGFSLSREDIAVYETVSDVSDESHAISACGTSESYSNIAVEKAGDADGDEADFYGTNAAVYAEDGAELALSDIVVATDGTHANAVFSYGEGTTVNISHSVIETAGNCSGGIMVTGGGTLNANGLAIHTTGNSSAAIRSDRGGGTQSVTGGFYQTDGTGSPVIYSTADVTVEDATLVSAASQGVVVEGKNSVTLVDCDLTASNTTKNSDKSSWYQAVMIYQSMSGDAAVGEARFTMDGGSLVNKNGDVFFANNTVCTISLSAAEIVNEDAGGVLLRAAAAGWGSEGSNGGHVTLNLADEQLAGDIVVDSFSELNMHLSDGTVYEGTINSGNEGTVYVEIEAGCTWKLTGDSYVDALTCDADAINLDGYTLYVDGVAYEAGTASTGSAIEFTLPEGGHGGPGMGEPPAKP